MRRVAISAVGAQMGGARRHLTGFVPALGELAPDWRFDFYVSAEGADWLGSAHIPANVDLIAVRQGGSGFWPRLWWDQVVLPRLMLRGVAEVLVSLLNFGPISQSIPQVNFQRNPVYYCSHYLGRVKGRMKLEALLRRWLCWRTMAASVRVVTPTAAMQRMIRGHFPQLPPDRFSVLPHAVDPVKEGDRAAPRWLVERVGDVPRPWMLYPGHAAPHKGHDILLEAIRRLSEENLDFTLLLTIDERDWLPGVRRIVTDVARLGLSRHVRILGRVPQADMLALYQLVDLVVFPSLCESFGFPLMEAMACGRPLVAAGTEVNREVSNHGAEYYDPEDPSDAARVLKSVIHGDPRPDLQDRARLRFAEFDWGWQRYVQGLADICDTALS